LIGKFPKRHMVGSPQAAVSFLNLLQRRDGDTDAQLTAVFDLVVERARRRVLTVILVSIAGVHDALSLSWVALGRKTPWPGTVRKNWRGFLGSFKFLGATDAWGAADLILTERRLFYCQAIWL
jgi:hypothetical protein